MIALARLVLAGGLVLTIVYLALWLHLRQAQRERLEAEAHALPLWEQDDHVRRGMAERAELLRTRLVLAVYLAPAIVMIAVIAVTNA